VIARVDGSGASMCIRQLSKGLRRLVRVRALWSLPLLLLATLASTAAHAQDDEKSAEQRMQEETPAIDDDNPEVSVPDQHGLNRDPLRAGLLLMELSSRAETAEKDKNYTAAIKYYQALAKMTPDRALPFSKVCELQILAGQPQDALKACRRATELQGAKLADHLRYASILLGNVPGTPAGATLSPADVAELDATFQHLDKDQVDAIEVDLLKCHLAVKIEDAARLRRCVERLQQKQPGDPLTVAHQFSLALLEHDYQQASGVIEQARQAGLPLSALELMEDELGSRSGPKPLERVARGVGAAALLAGVGWAGRTLWRRRRRAPATA
jgi:tetratricopeptide (TPR) repeat protein